MTKSDKVPISTTVNLKTKLYVQEYARQNELAMSAALDELISKIVQNEPVVTINVDTTTKELATIKDEVEAISTMLRYLSLKIENLPCNNL